MRKALNIQTLRLLMLIYFSASVFAAVPMSEMTHQAVAPISALANHKTMTDSASHCLSESHIEHGGSPHNVQPATTNDSEMKAHSASHDAEMNTHCDANCQCCIGSCSSVALLSEIHTKQAINTRLLTADLYLPLLVQHPSSLIKPPISS